MLGLLIILLLVSGGRAAATPAQPVDQAAEVLVTFHQPHPPVVAEQFARRYGGQQRAAIPQLGVHVLRFAGQIQLPRLLTQLEADAAVRYAEPNGRVRASSLPDDPGYPNQWGLATIKAPAGWNVHRGDPDVVIAIVDSGVAPQHPDLQSKLVPGWNYDAFSPGYASQDTADNNGHGTHVAGIAAAVVNNALGVAGTCPNCAIMPVKVLGADGSGTYDAVAAGVVYAADQGATVINLSLGGSAASQTLQDAVTYAASRGVLLVAAAGNDGTNLATYPAALPPVMAVAASTSADSRANFSNYNTYISVAAPGVDIYSTAWSQTAGSTYAYKSGTSMATPFVAGLAGLLAAQDRTRTGATLRTLIEQSADDINTAGWDQYTGYGRINVGRALGGTIAGRVQDATTGAALIGASVEALQAGQVKATTQTESDGTYRLQYIPAGTYDVRVSQAGYSAQTRTAVTAAAAHETSGIDFALGRVGAIAGRVTSGRKAVAGATVQARQGTQVLASATTDAYGMYQLSQLPSGTYTVTASATGYQSQSTAGIIVQPGQTTSGVNFSLAR